MLFLYCDESTMDWSRIIIHRYVCLGFSVSERGGKRKGEGEVAA